MLVAMSKAGVQIFIASHSYFVIKQLANCAKRDSLNIGCWNLSKEFGKPVKNTFHNLIDGVLPSNTIIDEALKMFDQEIDIETKILNNKYANYRKWNYIKFSRQQLL